MQTLCIDTIQIEQCRIKAFRSEHSLSFNCHINIVIIFRIATALVIMSHLYNIILHFYTHDKNGFT